jgi:hypothetical protein
MKAFPEMGRPFTIQCKPNTLLLMVLPLVSPGKKYRSNSIAWYEIEPMVLLPAMKKPGSSMIAVSL